MRALLARLSLVLLLAAPGGLLAQPEKAPAPPDKAPAPTTVAPAPPDKAPAPTTAAPVPTTAAPASQPAADPFERMPFLIPKDKLPPLKSVRLRTAREAADRSREEKITVSVSSSPTGAAVYYGGKLLGNTPFTIGATRGSTPYDVVIRRKGYMTLHTRIRRRESRSYYFKLNPAKFN
jgi:hypothetical protein